MTTVAVVALLLALPHRSEIAPLVEADNAYIFLAADRMFAGEGPTSIPPRAPNQPWTWRRDWTFLTQWPLGYPLLIFAARFVLGTSTASAAVSLGVVCCGVAMVAWFAWFRKCLPHRLPATLLALVAAGATFSIENLVHPSSDTVVLALTPSILLLTHRLVGGFTKRECSEKVWLGWFAVVGLAAGTLFWIRYAAIFVPLAIGIFFIIEWRLTKRVTFRQVLIYGVSSLVPVVALVVAGGVFGDDVSAREQLNLGHQVSFDFQPEMLVTAWTHFTEQTLYAHRPEAKYFFAAVLPMMGFGLPFVFRESRRAMKAFLNSPPVLLSSVMVVTLIVFLIAATVLFQGKYNYVGLDRYYQPVKPFYFLLFVGPILAFKPRIVRAIACIPLLLAGVWFVNQDARRTYRRWLSSDRQATEYGRWARRFEPNSQRLYEWLTAQKSPNLVVFSNFHDDIALETWIPACPTPADTDEMNDWLVRIKQARNVESLRVLFVLDPDNHSRAYYLPTPTSVVSKFGLLHPLGIPAEIKPYVYVSSEIVKPQIEN